MKIRIKHRRTAVGIAVTGVVAATGLALAVGPVSAHGNGEHGGHGGDAAAGKQPTADFGTLGAPAAANAVYFAASLNGANEVPTPGGPGVGDNDGRAVQFLRVQGNQVSFAIKWRGIDAPTASHIHLGKKGSNGAIKIPFFGEKLPDSVNSVTGTVTVADAHLLKDLTQDPTGFYANLHTAQFPGGAVRGQLHKVTKPVDMDNALSNFQASVITGKQIYRCTKQATGGFAFTQDNVAAKLGGGIDHSFVKPAAGPPQWIAPDGSAVTGTLLAKTPNGDGNIPELDLLATQSGKKSGLLANSVEILRLNTVGGVAPTGSCNPHTQPTAAVPYQADYLFIQG